MIEQLINSLWDNFYLFAFHYLCFPDAVLFYSLYGIWSLPVCLLNPCINCSKCVTKELRGFILLKTASDISLDLIALYRKVLCGNCHCHLFTCKIECYSVALNKTSSLSMTRLCILNSDSCPLQEFFFVFVFVFSENGVAWDLILFCLFSN